MAPKPPVSAQPLPPVQETEVDILVIGSGIAGLYAALILAGRGADVLVLTKSRLTQGNTQFAQGGIAAAFDAQDSPELHLHDTIRAGAGLCAEPAARTMAEEGPRFVRDLIALGAHFDRLNGEIALAREGAHTLRRVLHAHGDATGEEIENTLSRQARQVSVRAREDIFCSDLIIDAEGRCAGVVAAGRDGRPEAFRSRAVILATGGAGQVYSSTTNATVVTGDGIAMACRAGAEVMDMEFFQFHPTALAVESNPRFLISEAVRGDGALLLNGSGERFMPAVHRLAELAPRDVVARAIFAECLRTGTPHVWLDARKLHSGPAQERFPTIHARCLEHGLDMSRDLIPVAPVAHYCMGGVRTDTYGRTSVRGLFACGETACTGVHGANRLASNSLLESLVFAGRAAACAWDWDGQAWRPDLLPPREKWRPVHELPACLCGPAAARDAADGGSRGGPPAPLPEIVAQTREVMWRDFGIVRRAEGMTRGLVELDRLGGLFCAGWGRPASAGQNQGAVPGSGLPAVLHAAAGEARNLVTVATLIALSAKLREESRGAHFREDHPQADPRWRKHTLLRLSGRTLVHALAPLENVEVK